MRFNFFKIMRKINFRFLLLLVLSILTFQLNAQTETNSNFSEGNRIIPTPLKIQVSEKSITLPSKINISASWPEEVKCSAILIEYFKKYGRTTEYSDNGAANIILRVVRIPNKALGTEGYSLKTAENKIILTSNTETGMFYAIQSLIQMLELENKTSIKIHECNIVDKPEFAWRGIMLDVARHMLPLDYIKNYIDIMSFYKLNVLHLHLTDDQGWRIEIKKYPRLTEIASKRNQTLKGWQAGYAHDSDFVFDRKPYGGYYTQSELKELVAYAAARHITIVPEIEMPGHSVGVLAAYPELACKPGNYATATYWGVFDDIICPTPEALTFFKNVLDEVCEIFPGKYIHIGGDEAPKIRWNESEYVKNLMKQENIDNVEKVQGWFNRQIEEYLKSKDRKLIGWDEILEGGISSSAAVMSWRGEAGGIQAANAGNEVVMSPGSVGMYWDHAYTDIKYEPDTIGRREGNANMEKIYSYYPIPSDIDKSMIGYIKGVQANLWSEYIKSIGAHQYLSFPRMFALSEVAWSNPKNKNYADFTKRTSLYFPILTERNIIFRVPEPILLESNPGSIKLYTPIAGANIKYTTDGKDPSKSSTIYTEPIQIKKGTKVILKAVTQMANGKMSAPASFSLPIQ